jgi:hypothetical protein
MIPKLRVEEIGVILNDRLSLADAKNLSDGLMAAKAERFFVPRGGTQNDAGRCACLDRMA